MKILYDYSGLIQQRGGVSRYFVEMIKNLPDDVKPVFPYMFSDNIYLPSVTSHIGHIPFSFSKKESVYRHINRFFSKNSIQREGYDLFHVTASETYFKKELKKPLVVTIHDLIEEKILHHAEEIERRKWQIEHAAHIITVSENTKKDLLEYYNVSPEKVSVIYHGTPVINLSIPKKVPFQNYILYIGARNGYKNFDTFLECFSQLYNKDRTLNLVCVGGAFTMLEKTKINYLGINNAVHQISASDSMLYALYQHALVFVYPSIYEGFGIPILEAYENNCPVCLSNTSCFPEIATNAAVYFSPFSIDDMIDKVSSVIYNQEIRNTLIKRGRERKTNFTWKNAGEQTAVIYKSIL